MLQTAQQTTSGGGGRWGGVRGGGGPGASLGSRVCQLNLSSTRSCRRLDVQDDDMPAATAKAKASEAQA